MDIDFSLVSRVRDQAVQVAQTFGKHDSETLFSCAYPPPLTYLDEHVKIIYMPPSYHPATAHPELLIVHSLYPDKIERLILQGGCLQVWNATIILVGGDLPTYKDWLEHLDDLAQRAKFRQTFALRVCSHEPSVDRID